MKNKMYVHISNQSGSVGHTLTVEADDTKEALRIALEQAANIPTEDGPWIVDSIEEDFI